LATITLYKKSKRQPCYRLSYRDPVTGKWRMKLLHTTKEQADEIRKKVEAEFVWYQANPEKIPGDRAENITVRAARDAFIKSKQGTVKYLTVKRYEVALDNFELYYSDYVKAINRQVIDGYRSHLLTDVRKDKRKRTARGVNAELRHVKAYLKYCSENGWLEMPKITMAKELPIEVRWLTKGQVKSIKEKVTILGEGERQLVLDIMDVLLQTGARAREIIDARWSQINLSRKHVKPEDKGNTGKPLYLSKESVSILKRYKDNKPGPFPVNLDWFYWRYQKMADAAEIETTVHDLRRTCGAWLIQSGVDIYQVSKYLRHSSVTVTEKHYVDILPSKLGDIASKIGDQIAKNF